MRRSLTRTFNFERFQAAFPLRDGTHGAHGFQAAFPLRATEPAVRTEAHVGTQHYQQGIGMIHDHSHEFIDEYE